MTELEMYELWLTLREWANYNQLNQTIEKNWLSNSFNSHILDLLDKEEIKYRSEKRLLGYRNKGKRRLAGNACLSAFPRNYFCTYNYSKMKKRRYFFAVCR